MKHLIYIIAVVFVCFISISLSISKEYYVNYSFNNSSDWYGWNGIKSLEKEHNGYALKVSPNETIGIYVKNRANMPGLIWFNYSTPGCFNFKCKLNFAIDDFTYSLDPREIEGPSIPYLLESKNKKVYISWNCDCQDLSPNMKDGPRCIVDDVSMVNIEPDSAIPLQEITLDPSDKYLNDKINNSSTNMIKLKKGLHEYPIFISAGSQNIRLEPEIDPETNRPAVVIFDGKGLDQAIKLINTSSIVLKNITLKNAKNTLIIENCSNCTIDGLIINDFRESGIYINKCNKEANMIKFNDISSLGNEKIYGIKIDNTNYTNIYMNNIRLLPLKFHLHLKNSFNNSIYLFEKYTTIDNLRQCVPCPLIFGNLQCITKGECLSCSNESIEELVISPTNSTNIINNFMSLQKGGCL